MNNFRPSGPRDEASLPDGDQGFIGVEERLPPQQLSAGYVAGARNKRFRNGRAATRDGIGLLPWMKGSGLTPFTTVLGAAVIQDPNPGGTLGGGTEWILMAADGGVWKTRPNYVASPVPLPAGVTLTSASFTRFIQANAAIVLLRGLSYPPLVCTNLEQGFMPVIQANSWTVTFAHATNTVGLPQHNLLIGDPVRFTSGGPLTLNQTYYVQAVPTADSFTVATTPGGAKVTWNTSPTDAAIDTGLMTVLDGAVPIPPSVDGVFFGNRLLLINGKDTAAVSDIGDITRYEPATSQFRINAGDSYALVTVRMFNESTAVFFKTGNVKKVTGVTGDLSQAAGPLKVTDAYGAVAPGAVCAYGTEIYWLTSELRVSSLTLTALNQEQGTNNALSDPLFQTFGRVNAAYKDRARVEVYDGFLHVALPFESAQLLSTTELVPAGQTYTSSAPVVVNVTAGQLYHYAQGTTAGQLVNGTETLPGDADFTAQGATVSLYAAVPISFPAQPVACADSVRQVLANGVNTGVAVYDFLNQAWCGTDEPLSAGPTPIAAVGSPVCVVDWLKFTYGGRQRLGFLGADGWLHLYYEGYEDDAFLPVTPYVDVVVDNATQITGATTLQVAGGTVVTADVIDQTNQVGAATNWGCGGPAGANLWKDALGLGGYNPAATNPWTAPNTTPAQTDHGVRFVATNGVLPQVKINGTVTQNGKASWYLLDSHSGSEIQSVPIGDWMRTRAYLCQRLFTRNLVGDIKKYIAAAVQMGTWNPNYTLSAVTPGQGTLNAAVSAVTRNPVKFLAPFDAADWVTSNVHDDFNGPRRQDYSTALPAMGMTLGNNGATFDALQEAVDRVPVNERGVWMQVDVVNTQGRLEALAVAMESEADNMLSGVAGN